ncbi:MAG: hypothetical protein R2804_06605 [Cyclobacteriaceae bacterium]
MDSLEDDGLREVFSKLKGYESKNSGTTWEAVSRHLGSSGFSKAVILSLAVLIIAVPLVLTYDANSDRAVDGDLLLSKINLEAKDNSLLAQKVKIPSVQVIEKKNISNKERLTESKIVVNENKNEKDSQPTHVNQLSNSDFRELAVGSKEVVKNKETQLVLEKTDTTTIQLLDEEMALVEDEEIAPAKRAISIAVSAFYSFGVVEPLSADDVVLIDYQSKVGYGVKLNMMIPIQQNSIYTLDVGPAYQFMRKGFDFNTNDFRSEKIEHTSFKRTLANHFVGVGLQFGIRKRQLLFGSTIMKSVNGANTMNHYTGSAMLFLDATKEIKLKHENRYLQLGLSSGIPISGPYATFKYFPIQLSVGVRNVFGKI